MSQKRPNMTDLIASLTAPTCKESLPVVKDSLTVPQVVPDETGPAKPTRWRTLRTPEGQRPSPRQQQRDARNRAEAWYQAVREWRTRWREETISSRSSATTRPPSTNIVGQYTSGGGHVSMGYSVVYTPLGWLSEAAVGAAISRQGGLLERVRDGQGLSTLTDVRGGWHPQKGRAMEYARAALALAAELGDATASDYLAQIQ